MYYFVGPLQNILAFFQVFSYLVDLCLHVWWKFTCFICFLGFYLIEKKLEWQAIVIVSLIQSPKRSVLQRFLASSGHSWSTPTTASWIKLDKISTTSLKFFSRWSTSGVLALASSINRLTDSKLIWQVFKKVSIVSKLHDLSRDHKAS